MTVDGSSWRFLLLRGPGIVGFCLHGNSVSQPSSSEFSGVSTVCSFFHWEQRHRRTDGRARSNPEDGSTTPFAQLP